MNYEFSSTFALTQSGDTFTTDEKIKINKYSNKTQRLTFTFDGSIPSYLNLFMHCKNPVTNEEFYEPLLYDDTIDKYYYIIGTNISLYTGVWSLTIVGVQEDYDITGYNTLDKTLITYTSKPIKKLVVVNGEISEDAIAISYPNLEKALLDLKIYHDNVLDFTVQAAEIETKCEEILGDNEAIKESCEATLTECNNVLTECNSVLEECNTVLGTIETRLQQLNSLETNLNSLYSSLSNQLRAEYEAYVEELRSLREEG